MGTFTVTFSDVDGSVVAVSATKDKSQADVPGIGLGKVKIDDIEPSESFQQAVTLDFIHKPGRSICSIIVGGILFKWC